MRKLLGKHVAFVPCFFYKKSFHESNEEIQPVRGVIDFVNEKHGWYRIAYRVKDNSIQHECFKEADIGKAVKLLGHKKNS